MKKMNFEQMENIQGGASCFFAVPKLVLGACIPFGNFIFKTSETLVYCWNS